MISLTAVVTKSFFQLALRLVSQYKFSELKQLSFNLRPTREIGLDLLDVVDCLLDLEGSFHIPIPDEVPLFTFGDLMEYLESTLRFRIPF
ncbi:acyl carrier protein [uncultured Hymenobacter sp.]|uniref:acyl carrier protein n=1 Tax=uncultured Hymenobacter sp. TaxID=170016 RepID=UPI0035CB781C